MKTSVTIIGGGWSGLAAAVELCSQGIPVNLYESAKQLGGRARTVKINNMQVDNGEHLMIGAYREMLRLLELVGAKEEDLFLRVPHHLKVLDFVTRSAAFELKLPTFPAPLHLLVGMLRAPSLTLKEKLIILVRFNRLLNKEITEDMPAIDWISHAKLPQTYVDSILKPLCLAALTTHPEQASARAFQSVLLQTFNGAASNTDLLLNRKNLNDIFPQLARQYIEANGGQIHLEHKLNAIHANNNQISRISINDKILAIDHLILATPPGITQHLLDALSIANQLDQLEYEPITTVYIQYPPDTKLSPLMTGVINATTEWVFDRGVIDQPGLVSVVISASGNHTQMDNDTLINKVSEELTQLFALPSAESAFVIREKRATFRCTPDIDKIRPPIQTAINNLKLCGDYVYIEDNNQAGLPSTLEGALRAGVKCAQQLIQELN